MKRPNGIIPPIYKRRPDIHTWEEAISYCEALDLAGSDNWRLPNIKELFTLVDTSVDSPAIDTDYFPDTADDYYWSSSYQTHNLNNSWPVHFMDGWIQGRDAFDDASVRCVLCGATPVPP